MKMLKITSALLILFSLTIQAQDVSDHALGLRLGDSDGFGSEISYQHLLNTGNRLEIDLGFRDHRAYNAFKLTGLYQWVQPIDQGFNWFYGVGAGLGSVSFEAQGDDGTFVFAAGDIGIEYNFDFPLLLSLDIRPEIGLLGYNDFTDNFDFDIALGIRYQF